MPRTQIATPDLTALFSGGVAPPAFELRENRCETIDMADDRAPYVQSSGYRVISSVSHTYPTSAVVDHFHPRDRDIGVTATVRRILPNSLARAQLTGLGTAVHAQEAHDGRGRRLRPGRRPPSASGRL